MLTRQNLAFAALLIQRDVLAAQPAPASGRRTLVRAGHLLDVKTGKLLDGQTIVVVGDTIQSIAPTASVPAQAGDTVIDLGGLTVLPGPDRCAHAPDRQSGLRSLPRTDHDRRQRSHQRRGERAHHADGRASPRCAMWAPAATRDVDLRDAINAGQVPGPHMLVSGPPLGITGGHCDDNLLPVRISRGGRRRGRRHRRGAAQGAAEH